MQSRGQECIHRFRENFSKMCLMKKISYFYILKLFYLVCLVLGMNFKHIQILLLHELDILLCDILSYLKQLNKLLLVEKKRQAQKNRRLCY